MGPLLTDKNDVVRICRSHPSTQSGDPLERQSGGGSRKAVGVESGSCGLVKFIIPLHMYLYVYLNLDYFWNVHIFICTIFIRIYILMFECVHAHWFNSTDQPQILSFNYPVLLGILLILSHLLTGMILQVGDEDMQQMPLIPTGGESGRFVDGTTYRFLGTFPTPLLGSCALFEYTWMIICLCIYLRIYWYIQSLQLSLSSINPKLRCHREMYDCTSRRNIWYVHIHMWYPPPRHEKNTNSLSIILHS